MQHSSTSSYVFGKSAYWKSPCWNMKSSGVMHEAVRGPISICKHILSIFWGWKRLFSKHTETEQKTHHAYIKKRECIVRSSWTRCDPFKKMHVSIDIDINPPSPCSDTFAFWWTPLLWISQCNFSSIKLIILLAKKIQWTTTISRKNGRNNFIIFTLL